jgi:hypothetical protein
MHCLCVTEGRVYRLTEQVGLVHPMIALKKPKLVEGEGGGKSRRSRWWG